MAPPFTDHRSSHDGVPVQEASDNMTHTSRKWCDADGRMVNAGKAAHYYGYLQK
jgi:hypothetical protein